MYIHTHIYTYIWTVHTHIYVHVQRTEGAAGAGETEGGFIGLVLLHRPRTHILSLTVLKAKGFKCVWVTEESRDSGSDCLLLEVAHVGQGHIMFAWVEHSDVDQRLCCCLQRWTVTVHFVVAFHLMLDLYFSSLNQTLIQWKWEGWRFQREWKTREEVTKSS